MKKLLLSLSIFYLLINSQFTLADSFYCQYANKPVNTGEAMADVQAACGAPTSASTQVDTSTSTTTTPQNSTQQWVYTALGRMTTPQGTTAMGMVPALVFTITNDQVTQIQRSGSPLAQSIPCGIASTLGVNSTGEMVRLACGNPSYIQNVPGNNVTTQNVTVWTYNRGPYEPQMIFDFENGVLTKIVSGQLGS